MKAEAQLVNGLRKQGYNVVWRDGHDGWEFLAELDDRRHLIRIIHYADQFDSRYTTAVAMAVGSGIVRRGYCVSRDGEWIILHVVDNVKRASVTELRDIVDMFLPKQNGRIA